MSNHSLAETPVAISKPAPVKLQTQEHVAETRTIIPRKIAPNENTVKVEAVHHKQTGNTDNANVPVEKFSKSSEGPVNEKDFEGF